MIQVHHYTDVSYNAARIFSFSLSRRRLDRHPEAPVSFFDALVTFYAASMTIHCMVIGYHQPVHTAPGSPALHVERSQGVLLLIISRCCLLLGPCEWKRALPCVGSSCQRCPGNPASIVYAIKGKALAT